MNAFEEIYVPDKWSSRSLMISTLWMLFGLATDTWPWTLVGTQAAIGSLLSNEIIGWSGGMDDQMWWIMDDQLWWMIRWGGFSGVVDDEDDRQTINLLLSQWPMGRLYFTLIKMYSFRFNIHPLTVSDVLIFFACSTIMGLVKMYKWGSCWQYSFMHYLIGLGFTLTQWPYPISYAYANAL